MLGLERYRALRDAGAYVRFDGGLRWGDGVRDSFTHQQSIGYPAEWLPAEDVVRRVPGVHLAAIPAEGALLNPAEGWVDLPALVDELVHDLVDAGGELRTDAGRCALVRHGEGVAGVAIGTDDVLPADVVVLATGAAVPGSLAELGVHLPDGTTNALLVRTPPFDHQLRAVLNTPRVAVRPSPGGGVVLDAGWAEEEVVARGDGTFEVRDSTVEGLLREASAVLAGSPELSAESFGVGRKPIPGDGHPVLGSVPGVRGLHVAFTHSGATIGLIAGELLAEEIVTGDPSPLLDTFRPERFLLGTRLSDGAVKTLR
jgi:glycine/D-amino acid oxidase-like deaminating enzyme